MFSRRQFCGAVATTAVLGSAIQPVQADDKDPKTPKPDSVPEKFVVKIETSKGDILIAVNRAWSPNGAARFYDAVKAGFYDDCRFFRVLPGFMAQWGIHGNPKVMEKWSEANIPDDRPSGTNRQSNTRGMVTFAKSGQPNSRSTQIFASYVNNSRLDPDGFTPFGRVLSGMEVLESLNSKYGEEASHQQGRIQEQGNAFLDKAFPGLDTIKKASFIGSESSPDQAKPDENKPAEDEKS